MMNIKNRSNIELMVGTFYDSVRQDEILGSVFLNATGDDWTKHLDTMYRFWKMGLLHQFEYNGSPFALHQKLPIDHSHFDR
ncbi:group III truncated hemoglobin [uncultured Aquimarina sp.]|uniref:group III truncated hemoglobin n=1 Tax=uncultured Aquimarina sp. TaxID=575652 RepID=UPI0026188071|nr:group III truncated hemoglobin [uncultured Aquimarina sp.]